MDVITLFEIIVGIIGIVSFILILRFTSQGSEIKHNVKIALQKFLKKYPSIEEFYDSYKDVPWQKYIESAKEKIDIVVYYYDSWVRSNFDSLKYFFSKPNTKIRLFLSDPNRKENIENLKRIFSEYKYKEEHLKLKVENTREKIVRAAEEVGASPTRVILFYYPYYLNYSAVCFDDKILILSFYEFKREAEIKSPVIIINLENSPTIREFWKKERDGLIKSSKLVSEGEKR